ncbi:DNA polymerase alpha subunit B N-terminal [Penicillium coprophilum]|uniref:DNA polymerase alpha subunit B N-terminal n=1 Tax=Penicillium coprophilum TaxID=36646 RepID=UPI0023894A1F|nr:DNA polymerase alpha subunit B N-terminal [Penicillium coprophilum]KAJ5177777.1 DNA polymerase alpha subunit B N-terminal [Penicillium coprophilum]
MDVEAELNEFFAGSFPDGIPKDILAELLSILRVHSITAEELFYKWESYSIKMGEGPTRRETKHKHGNPAGAAAAGGDMFGMFDQLTPTAANARSGNGFGSVKRKAEFTSPATPRVSKFEKLGSQAGTKTPTGTPGDGTQAVPFSDRTNPGQTIETLNAHISLPEPPMVPFSEARIRPTANTDLKKLGYKPMGMKLSEASEILDDRIDEFATIFQAEFNSDDITFGSAAIQSTSEIIAVGRIASDSLEGKLNAASLVLETSRRTGAGRRVPLKVDSVPAVNFFPGQIVALRGINPSGEYFTVKEVLPVPLMPPAVSSAATLDSINERLGGDGSPPLNLMVAAGPYTADDNLDFEPLQELCQKAAESYADSLVLMGPFLDIEHPLLASGDFDLPDIKGIDPDTATLSLMFRHCISAPLARLAAAVPSITIVMVPSVRDALSRHVSWPQEQLLKKDTGLPKQVRMVSNPVTLSFNEITIGMCPHDVLSELRREEVLHGRPTENNPLLTRLPKYLPGSEGGIATGAMVDLPYLKLGEWWNVRPDILIVPSMLPPFVKVVDSVLVINPGTLSKRRAAGSYAQMSIHPRLVAEHEREQKQLSHNLYERARVDINRI